ncbi:MAG: radical SAM protein [Chloroflexota bacterium]|nr:radical SAM protein [Chloroflexota bacterium]
MNIEQHPCFNDKVRHTFGRVHLPVAPRCNVQCNFCNRQYDCINESRPGVTSGLLSPDQALLYLDAVMKKEGNISVVGIAGPGDPFANSKETMEILTKVRQAYSQMLLCVATNGLGIGPHIDELADLKVSHVTITINAVNPQISEKIYAWIRYNKRVINPQKGAHILLEHQLDAITRLKEIGVAVKVNSIILPGINDHHIPEVAQKMGAMGVDILNVVPHYPNEGSAFSNIPEPSRDLVESIRNAAAEFLPQMSHCTRCRADAVGLLGEELSSDLVKVLKTYEGIDMSPVSITTDRPYVAVTSREGILINQHLGEASQLLIYGQRDNDICLLEARKTPQPSTGNQRWDTLAEILGDCAAVMISSVGANPRRILEGKGIAVMEIEGLIDEVVRALFRGDNMKSMIKRPMKSCDGQCSGGGIGCG